MPTKSPLTLFHPPVRAWFDAVFPAPTRPQQLGWPAIARGESTLILAPTGTGKTLAAFLWCINRLMFSPVPPPPRALPRPLHFAHQGPRRRCRTQPALPAGRHRPGRPHRGRRVPRAHHRHPHRRHPGRRARPLRPPPRRHSDHHAGIDLPAAHLQRARSAALRRDRRARRNPRARADQARQPPRALAGTPRSPLRPQAAAHRTLRHAASARRSRPLSRRRRPPRAATAKKERPADAAGEILAEFESASAAPIYRAVTIVDAGEPKRIDLRIEVPLDDMSRLDEIVTLPSGPASQAPMRPSIWSAIHPKLLELVRAHTSTLIFVNSRRLAERISGAINELAGETLVRAHHGSVAADAAQGDRRPPEDGHAARARRHLVARTRHRHGRDRSRGADRSAAFGRQRHAARRPRQPSRGRYQRRRHLPQVPRRPGRLRRDHARHVRGQGGVGPLSAQSARRAGAADRRHGGHGPVGRQRALHPGPPGRALRRSHARRLRCVLDMLSGRYPSDEFAELRPRLTWDRITNQLTSRAGRAQRRRHQRRHHSRSRPVHRLPGRRHSRRARRRTG